LNQKLDFHASRFFPNQILQWDFGSLLLVISSFAAQDGKCEARSEFPSLLVEAVRQAGIKMMKSLLNAGAEEFGALSRTLRNTCMFAYHFLN